MDNIFSIHRTHWGSEEETEKDIQSERRERKIEREERIPVRFFIYSQNICWSKYTIEVIYHRQNDFGLVPVVFYTFYDMGLQSYNILFVYPNQTTEKKPLYS